MNFELVWVEQARDAFAALQDAAGRAAAARAGSGRAKASQAEGRFKQAVKCLDLLADNPRHPSLQTHQFHSRENPFDPKAKVFEAYVQQRTPGAYRLFWCYGPDKYQITILGVTPHP